MHIAPFNNQNKPLVDVDDATVPLNYFNIVKLTRDQAFSYQVPGYETCIVPATGSVDVDVEGFSAKGIYLPSCRPESVRCDPTHRGSP